jgi:hypothetical protein
VAALGPLTRLARAAFLSLLPTLVLSSAALAAPVGANAPCIADWQACAATDAVQGASAVLEQTIWTGLVHMVADGASSVITELANDIGRLTDPDLGATYLGAIYQRAANAAAIVALAVAMAAAAFHAVTRNGLRLLYVTFGYPGLVALGIAAAPAVLTTVLRVTDALAGYVAGGAQLTCALRNLGTAWTADSTGFVGAVAALGAIAFGIVAIIELLARSTAITWVVVLWPIALASSAWGGGFGLARRFLKVLTALVLAKPVMVIAISLGVAMIGQQQTNGACPTFGQLDVHGLLQGLTMLLVVVAAPLAPFALIGGAEAAVAGQLQVRERVQQVATAVRDTARWSVSGRAEPAPASGARNPTLGKSSDGSA